MITNREPDEEVLLALELAELCQGLGVLPRAGGLLDQDYYHVVLLKAGLRGIAKKAAADSKRAK